MSPQNTERARGSARIVQMALLAAGSGSRFTGAGHKLLALLPATTGRPTESVIHRCIATAVEARSGTLLVITGRLDADALGLDQIADVDAADFEVAHNDRWAEGQMTSVQVGLRAATDRRAEVTVIGLADQPGIEPDAWNAVARAVTTSTPIGVATYDRRRANPVALHRDAWDLLPTSGDEGARALMRLRPDLVIEVPCTGSPMDIDTVEDLTRWQNN